jgi:putative phosphoribosyl transferase
MQPELAIGAIADGEHPELVVNRGIVEALGIPASYLEEERNHQLMEIERRRNLYLAGRPRPRIAGKTVIVVDDGIATGATIRAALRAVRRAGPKRLVLAVPVASAQTITELRHDVDDVECLESPEDLWAIGGHYGDFTQVTDSEVMTMLQEAAQFAGVESGKPRGDGETRA